MKYIFALLQVVTLIWLVALAFPQGDSPNEIVDDSIRFDNNEPSSSTPITLDNNGPSSTTPSSTAQESTTACPCVTTAEYNPICGSDNVTYWNMGRFNCAKNCNPALEVRVIRACEPYSQLSSN